MKITLYIIKVFAFRKELCCFFIIVVKRLVLTYYWKFLPINNVHVICLPHIVQFTLLYYVTIIID